MARRLSNLEWGTFLHEVDVRSMGFPPWGGVVEWGGMQVLVYIGPAGEVFLTDVSGSQFASNFVKTWDPNSQVWWYHLPRETMATIVQQSEAVLVATKEVIHEVGTTVGQTTADLIGPLIKQLWLPIVIALVILGLIYLPFPRLLKA